MTRRFRLTVFGSLLVLLYTAAGPVAAQNAPASIRPGAPGESSRPAAEAQDAPRYAEADVQFMQGMILHHAQALDMTALVPERSTNRALRTLAERIEVSQTDEIAWMQRWLQDRHEDAPMVGMVMHHGAGHGEGRTHGEPEAHPMLMPGMLTPDEMVQLAAATGPAFDRFFLQYMIRHHEGGLIMVANLLATEGGAQAPEVFRIATDIDADQRADIDRMHAMLDVPPLPSLMRSN